MSSRLGAQVLALKPIQGHSQKCVTDKQTDRHTDRQTDRHTHRTMYRVPPELKINKSKYDVGMIKIKHV